MFGAAPAASAGTEPAAAAGRAASAPDGVDARQLAAIEAQWCSHGAQAHQQAMDALKAGHPRADVPLGGNWNDPAVSAASDRYHEARRALPTVQARLAVQARLVRSWADALLRRGDLQARATAHYLGATTPHLLNERELHARQLVELARSNPDPYLARLWQKLGERCHGEPQCQSPPAGHWATIEPGNALAWLPSWKSEQPMSEVQWLGLAQASYARAPEPLLLTHLLDQVDGLSEGMALDVALQTIEHFGRDSHLNQTALELSRHCWDAAASRRSICLHAANLHWNHSHPWMRDRIGLLELAEELGATRESPWRERIAAIQPMLSEQFRVHMLEAFSGPESEQQPGCSALLAKRQRLRDQAEGGVWRAAQRRLGQL